MSTTIKVYEQTKTKLDEFREYKNESYDDVINKLVFIAKTTRKNPKLSQETVKSIEEARKRISKGEFFTEKEAKKALGL